MGNLKTFIRKWGGVASYIHLPDGSRRVAHVNHAELALPDLTDSIAKEMVSEFQSISDFSRRGARVRRPMFEDDIKVNRSVAKWWDYDEKDILNAEYNPSGFEGQGKLMQKFSWNPVTGEFLLVPPPNQHAMVKGKAPFDDYVRGIILRGQNKVTFRPFWPTWMQEKSRDFTPDAWEVSFDAQEAAEEVLKRHGGSGWTYQYNVTNKTLQDMTGQYRW